jgi:bifunctional UDP-N-acetylglucosamine pyrophosphorylase / glucosamine-1-phosphate N-acetyltransferase
MRSSRPKSLHRLCGRPLTQYVLDAAAQLSVRATIVVVGDGATWVEKELGERATARSRLVFVDLSERPGGANAIAAAVPAIGEAMGSSEGDVVFLPGDTPLLRGATVSALLEQHRRRQAALSVLTAHVADPSGYGRVVRAGEGTVAGILEPGDAPGLGRPVDEVSTSVMAVRASVLGPALRRIERLDPLGRRSLSELAGVLHAMGHVVEAMPLEDPLEASAVNDRSQLAAAEQVLRRRINERWMRRGVTMWDPSHTYVDADVQLSPDVSLLPGTTLKGRCVIARGARIGPNAFLLDTRVGENARLGTVEANGASIGAGAHVHSYAVLGPGAEVADAAVVGPLEARQP